MLTRYNSGQAVIVSVVLLLLISLVLVGRGANPARADAALMRGLLESKRSAITSEAGSEDVTYRVRSAMEYDDEEVLSLNGGVATSTVTDDTTAGTKTVVSEASVRTAVRLKSLELVKGDLVEFNYGVQVGNGGFIMANSAQVEGNVYSNGTVTGAGNLIKGSVVSADSAGLLEDIHATSSVWAHTITDADIDGDAYYQAISDSTVLGTSYPGSPDKSTTTFPISDDILDEWEAIAESGGTISSPCPYKITTNTTLGPKKINCDMEISNNAELTLSGMTWVVGDFSIKNNTGVRLDPALGKKSIAIIADDPTDRAASGLIDMLNSTTFQDSGTDGSFLFLVSRNTSALNGGAIAAIDLKNTASGPVVLYSNWGKIPIGNNTNLKALTGYTISMKNSAKLVYDDGLESSLFDTGPGGSWNIVSWKESQ